MYIFSRAYAVFRPCSPASAELVLLALRRSSVAGICSLQLFFGDRLVPQRQDFFFVTVPQRQGFKTFSDLFLHPQSDADFPAEIADNKYSLLQ